MPIVAPGAAGYQTQTNPALPQFGAPPGATPPGATATPTGSPVSGGYSGTGGITPPQNTGGTTGSAPELPTFGAPPSGPEPLPPPVWNPNVNGVGGVEAHFGVQRGNQIAANNARNAAFDQEMRAHSDRLYAESERRLNPQFEQQQRAFEQSLVSRGIDPNSEAGKNARAQFDQARNDAFATARANADQAALGYQNQSFQQDLANRQLQQQELDRQQQIAMSAIYGGMDNQRWEQQFNEGRRQFDQGQQNWQSGFNASLDDADFSRMLGLMGFDRDNAGFNNQAQMQDLQQLLPFFGMIPQGGPAGIDVLSGFNMQQQAHQAAQQAASSANNGLMGAIGQIGAAAAPFLMMSDVRLKTDIERIGTADNGVPIYRYRYKIGGPVHIGVMAQDVEKTHPNAVHEVSGFKAVNYAEVF